MARADALAALDALLDEHDAYLTIDDATDSNTYYLSGFDAHDDFVFLRVPGESVLLVPQLEVGRARKEAAADTVRSYGEFDDGDETFGTGWWLALHYHINQLGYQANDGEEEIDLLFENLRNRLYALTVGVDVSRAEAKIDELVDELESLRPDLPQYRDEHGEHEHRYADRETVDEGW